MRFSLQRTLFGLVVTYVTIYFYSRSEIRTISKNENGELDNRERCLNEVASSELNDTYISVKTTRRLHKQRIGLLLDTWVQLARKETHIFTDADDIEYKRLIPDGHLIVTKCPPKHSRKGLCCKLAAEYDHFMASSRRWLCHVDDDTYVNIPNLARLLQKYNPEYDWYLGKPSLDHPLEVKTPKKKYTFWFATGGAGFCLSRALALKMKPFMEASKFEELCQEIVKPDDVTIAFIVYNHLRTNLTIVPEMNSHIDNLPLIKPSDLDQQITYSYLLPNRTVSVPGFNTAYDPTRLRSLHCRLFPCTKDCPVGLFP